MDNITHTLTGLMMARAGLGRTTERGGSLMLMLAANAPDIDALFGFPGSLTYLQYHRWYPHSLACVPLMAVLPLLLARWIRGATITWRSYLACVLGVLSHLALDFTNVYGIRLLLPFSSRWLHLDITDIVDIWIWIILILGVAAPALSGLVNSEIRGAKSPGPKRGWAWVVLIAVLSYEGFRYASHQRAIAVMSAYEYGGDTAPRVHAFPGGTNPLRWKGVVETPASTLIVPVSVAETYDPGAGESFYPAPESPALTAARSTPLFQTLLKFDQMPFFAVTPEEDLERVVLTDLRFGTPRRPGFVSATVFVTTDGHVRDTRYGVSLVPRR